MARSRQPKQLIERLESRRLLADAVAGVGSGLIANYFADTELNNLALARVDANVNFAWGGASPGIGVPADGFSARWTGKVQAQHTESYTFYTQSDEGVALWVNGQKLIDNFTDHTLSEDSGTISLKAGELYDIRLEYYDNAFDATMQLSWSSPSTAKAPIPSAQLYGDAGWTSAQFLNAAVGGASGSVSSFGETYNVTGSGPGTGGSSDGFEFLYKTLDGDGTLVAQVTRTEGTGGGAEAGIMFRQSLAAGSPYTAVVVDAAGNAQFESRTSADATVVGSFPTNSGAAGPKSWVKLVRDGNLIRGYASPTGAEGTWTSFGTRNVALGRTVYAGLTATSGSNGGQNRAQFQNVSLVATPPLGAGLDAVRDYSVGNVFVDIAKQARTFQGPDLGPTVATDANGWPTADFMTILLTGYANTAHVHNGTYKASFTGQADVDRWATPGGQILNKQYNAATNTTTFDYVINASESSPEWYAALQFRNTRRTPASALNSGITNLKVIRPGYAANTTQVFQDNYLAHLKQFSVLRFMDWTATNNNQTVEWSQRTTLNSARQSSTNGVAWEHVIQLANQLDKDLWINIPAKASDNYVQQLAQLLKDTLEPERAVYVEYSNEVWNGIFTQNQENLNLAIAEVNAGGSPLNADGETNQIYWGWRRVANRLKQVSDIFGQVWGQNQINARVRPVLASQFANSLIAQEGLEFIERTYGAPNQFFYGVGIAPYIAMGSIDDTRTDLSVEEILAKLTSSANNQKYFQYDTFARRYGLQNMVYEGGPDVAGGNNLAAKRSAMLDPRMRDLIGNYLNGWYKTGGGLFAYFVAGPTAWTANGMWGLSNLIDNLGAPKNQATIDVAGAPRVDLNYGHAVPATFDARAVAGATTPYANPYQKDPDKGKSFDYFVRAPRAGRYQIIFNGGTNGSNEQIRVAVNNTAVRTITLKNTGSNTTFADNIVGTFELEEGMNLIHVTSENEPNGWNLQTVTVKGAPAGDAAPTVATAAAASPMNVTGKTTTLSVLGADNGGESGLTYSWEAINEQPLNVVFSANGSNAAKNTVATFTRPGTYTFRVTISDGVNSATSSVQVTVSQVITSVTVAPTGMAVANGESQQLVATAKDQFGVNLYAQPTFAWQVDNGFGTVSQAGLYTSPGTGLQTATVRATVNGVSGTATVVTQSPRPADVVANPMPGIEYAYYEGTYNVVADFDAATPVKTGLLNNISIGPRNRNDNFAFIFNGYMYLPTTGTYTFYLSSDDGSKLWVGGQQVVNNDGKHAAQEKIGSIILDAGWHQFKVSYFDSINNQSLSLLYTGPGVSTKTALADGALQRSNRAPTIPTPPAANPNPITGNSADLSVVGADEAGEAGLTYTWSTVAKPAGANNPAFSINGTNAAKNSTATFSRAGAYQLQVTISDGTLTSTATLNVVVDATLTTIQISPQNPSVRAGATQQFSATGYDQFGNPLPVQPAFNWAASANGGTFDASGLYTAPSTAGSYTVTAFNNGASASTGVTVTPNGAPTVATPASAQPSPTTSGQATLSVLGADDGGEAALTYTWVATTVPPGAAAPTYDVNGTNAAKQAVVTLSQPGHYAFQVTISDGSESITSTVTLDYQSASSPTVATPASSSPSTVTGTTSALSVLGSDDGGEANLTYTWATVGTPPAAVAFSANGTNAAKSVTATFAKAGTYTFAVTISDGSGTAVSQVSVVVSQTVASVSVAPASTTLANGASRQFTATALDQFGAAMAAAPAFTWSASATTGSAGSITQNGLYTAPASGSAAVTVTAGTSNGASGAASVTVNAPVAGDAFGSSADIGIAATKPAGSYTFDPQTGLYTVRGSGADIWNNADQFHFVYRQLSGDGQIVARVASVQNTHARAKAGLMFRESLAVGSRQVNVELSPDNTSALQYRTGTNNGTSSQGSGFSTAGYWLKLVRSGNTFTGSRSSDGVNWSTIGSVGVTMGTTVYVGLSLTSHDTEQLNTSTYDNVTVQQGAALAGAAMSDSAATPTAPLTAKSVTDGSLDTYYQSTRATGAWVGLDFGSSRTITQISFAPRKGYEAKLVGGKFQASNDADFSTVTDLYTVKSKPKNGKLTVQSVAATSAFRYVRYLAPDGTFGNIAETAFVGF